MRKRTVHGYTGTKTYRCWHNMIDRCECKTDKRYPNYGGRGIKVCERWQSFPNFLVDMGVKPEGLTLERKDNEGNYEPSNCKWATYSEQNLNNRHTSKLTAFGKTMSVTEWARQLGCDSRIIWKRLTHQLWTPEDAVSIPVVRGDCWFARRYRRERDANIRKDSQPSKVSL